MDCLFDKNGIPLIPNGFSGNLIERNSQYYLKRPNLSNKECFRSRIQRLHEGLRVDTGITAKKFRKETRHLVKLIERNSHIANILNCVWLPIICPRLVEGDIGTVVERYVNAASNCYAGEFPNRKLVNYRKNTLKGRVDFIPNSHQEKNATKMIKDNIIGLYFPNVFQGFSIDASRKFMTFLPEYFSLAGLEPLIALITYPDILGRDWDAPCLCLSSLLWESNRYSLCLGINDIYTGFHRTASLTYADGRYSSGLFFTDPYSISVWQCLALIGELTSKYPSGILEPNTLKGD